MAITGSSMQTSPRLTGIPCITLSSIAYALLDSVLPGMHVSLGVVCLLLPVLAIARGVLHYA